MLKAIANVARVKKVGKWWKDQSTKIEYIFFHCCSITAVPHFFLLLSATLPLNPPHPSPYLQPLLSFKWKMS